jgi:hypothetical protein
MRRWKEFCKAVKRIFAMALFAFAYIFRLEESEMLKNTWVDKQDGVDINSANDINEVAHAVIDLEGKKTAYEYAKDGGYEGTEEEFAKDLAKAITGGGGSPTPAYTGEVEVV